MQTYRPRVLMAATMRAAQRLSRVLEGFEIERARSIDALIGALERTECDLVIIAPDFESAGALEAVELALEQGPRAPVICVRAAQSRSGLDSARLEALREAAEQLGVQAFVDVSIFPDDQAGNARARAVLERLLPVNGRRR